MRIALVACAAVLSAVTLPASQDHKRKTDKPVIVVTGCVDGTWLHVKSAGPGGYAEDRVDLGGQLTGGVAGRLGDTGGEDVGGFVEQRGHGDLRGIGARHERWATG